MGQTGICEQLDIRNFPFLWNSYRSNHYIIYTCTSNALHNLNTCSGYKLVFYRYLFNIDTDSSNNSKISRLSVRSMNDNQIVIVNNLRTLIFVKEGSHFINSFTTNEINDLVNEISVMYTILKDDSTICLLQV